MQRVPHRTKSLGAFTLVELLVVMAIITILVAILLPALGRAQALAKSSKCQSNLSSFGKGFTLYSNQNEGYYSSGSSSPRYDRANSTRVGWVADLVNGGYATVFELNCPANDAQFSETLPEMLTDDDGTYSGGAQNTVNVDEIQVIVKKGYMTNFVASWYLTRTAMLPSAWQTYLDGADATPPTTNDALRVDFPDNCYGPMTSRTLDNSVADASKVPLLADGNLGNFDTATLDIDCAPFKKGEIGTEATTDGPRKFRDGGTYYAGDTADQVVVSLTKVDNAAGATQWVGQDFVDFGPVHGGGNKKWCNILFADGHVLKVDDKDNDTVIGFSGSSTKPGDLTELERIFCGNLVSKSRTGSL